MPHMDGVSFLRKIMSLRPMPVVMISTLTKAGAEVTLEALEIGAIDFIAKPATNQAAEMAALAIELQTKVKNAARTKVGSRRSAMPAQAVKPKRDNFVPAADKIVLIGASTGGVEALKVVLMGLPANCPPILITQHMPPRFTAAVAERLNRECPVRVSEAKQDDPVEVGHVYIAPGSHHLELARKGPGYVCAIHDGAPVSGHRPSVDVLFRSGTKVAGPKIVSAILTGMGKDGAQGMLELHKAGAVTIGQDEHSSLIYGMPRAAFELGGVQTQVPLDHVAEAILDACAAKSAVKHHA
jgi:two-component system chemotaxis response regulator CheB